MGDELKRTALIYDFDGTLAQGNLQEQSFIPNIGMSREEFWDEVKTRTRDEDADEILVYMHLMIEKAQEKGVLVSAEEAATPRGRRPTVSRSRGKSLVQSDQ